MHWLWIATQFAASAAIGGLIGDQMARTLVAWELVTGPDRDL